MKIIKLVLTGIGILMCIILVAIKRITGTAKQVQHITTFMEKDSTGQNAGIDEMIIHPYCIPASLTW